MKKLQQMKLNLIVLSAILTGITLNAEKPSPVSYEYGNFLWHNNRRLYWPDSSEIHRTCWNNYVYNFHNSKKDYSNEDCQIAIHYINAIQDTVYNQEKREEYQKKLAKNQEALATIKTSQNNDNANNAMISIHQTVATKNLLQDIQDNEKALAAVPKDLVPINFPTDGTQKDKDAFKNAIFNLLPHYSNESVVEEIAKIKSVLERARNGKLYESK